MKKNDCNAKNMGDYFEMQRKITTFCIRSGYPIKINILANCVEIQFKPINNL
jgi:hypothetical protein